MRRKARRGLAVHIDAAIAEVEDLEDGELAAQEHGDQLGTAFFVGAREPAENRAPGLARLVPAVTGLFVRGLVGGWSLSKLKTPAAVSWREFATPVTYPSVSKEMDCNLSMV